MHHELIASALPDVSEWEAAVDDLPDLPLRPGTALVDGRIRPCSQVAPEARSEAHENSGRRYAVSGAHLAIRVETPTSKVRVAA